MDGFDPIDLKKNVSIRSCNRVLHSGSDKKH